MQPAEKRCAAAVREIASHQAGGMAEEPGASSGRLEPLYELLRYPDPGDDEPGARAGADLQRRCRDVPRPSEHSTALVEREGGSRAPEHPQPPPKVAGAVLLRAKTGITAARTVAPSHPGMEPHGGSHLWSGAPGYHREDHRQQVGPYTELPR